MIELVDRTAPKALVKELARSLPNVRIVWDRPHGLWMIEERGRSSGQWMYVCYWAELVGAYRVPQYLELPTSIGPILQKLHEIDMSRFMRTPKAAWAALEREMDDTRVKKAKDKWKKWKDALSQYAPDLRARAEGGRQTFGFGKSGGANYGRSRLWIPRGSDVTRAYAAELEREP